MAFQIMPQEFHILGDNYVIRTRVPVDEIKDAMILLRVRNANLTAGDKVTVQCMTHAYDRLLHEAEFRVVSRNDAIVLKEIDDRETRQVNEITFEVARKGEWWSPDGVSHLQEQPVTVLTDGKFIDGEAKWNVGSKAYDIFVGDEKVAEGIKDREQAHAIAAGKLPIPTEPAKAA